MGKSGPLERASLANQIQGFRIPDRWDTSEKNNNLLLTEREGRTGEYWPEVVARSVQKRPRADIPQYVPEQVKLVSSLLYGIIFRTKQHF